MTTQRDFIEYITGLAMDGDGDGRIGGSKKKVTK